MGKDLTCPICTNVGVKEPFVAECGHIACLGCWKSWLDRSASCPTCRKVVSKESIARVVFEAGPSAEGEKVDCGDNIGVDKPEGQDHSSDDDELEFV
jgi:hypothetical protein